MSSILDKEDGLKRIVADYLANGDLDARREDDWFGDPQLPFVKSIERAARSEIEAADGKRIIRQSHQRRIPGSVLGDAVAHLEANARRLQKIASFEALLDTVNRIIRPIPGIGELAVYDIAERIGLRLGVVPTEVYLHAGTRLGAKALGLTVRRRSIPIDEFPLPFRKLTAAQLENLLCLYNDHLVDPASFSGSSNSCGTGKRNRRCA